MNLFSNMNTLYLMTTTVKGKGKRKVHPGTGHEGRGTGVVNSSTLSLASALYGVGGQCHALAALPLGKTQYPLCRRLGGQKGWSGRVWKIPPPLGFDTRTVQPIARCYTD